jgi:hypothetical protein
LLRGFQSKSNPSVWVWGFVEPMLRGIKLHIFIYVSVGCASEAASVAVLQNCVQFKTQLQQQALHLRGRK